MFLVLRGTCVFNVGVRRNTVGTKVVLATQAVLLRHVDTVRLPSRLSESLKSALEED